MSKPARFTKLKIAISYLLLLGLIFISLHFIKRELGRMSTIDNSQLLQTDSLLSLIKAKDDYTLSMLQHVTLKNDSLISITEQEETIAIRDSIIELQRVKHNVVQSRDSIITTRPKRGFFQRVAEVFVPTTDTTVTVKSQVHQITDTLLSELPTAIPEQVIRRVTRTKSDTPLKAIRRGNARLHEINNVINTRIDSLLSNYKEEAYQQAREEARMQQEQRINSTKTLTMIAIGAILLAVIFLIIICYDIQRSIRYRRELEIANRRAAELIKARENLMLTITHDFKAPLSSIIGYNEMLASLLEGKDPEEQYLMNMKNSSDHLLKLVNDMLDFHRLDLNKVQVNKQDFNPAELLDEIRFSFEPLASTKGLYFKYSLDPKLNDWFSGDPLRITQVVNNLLSNAIKFTPRGGISLSARNDGSAIVITVSDSGKGMKDEDRERIFNEFTRLPDAQGEEGFGIGLSIVRKLVDLLSGSIRVESNMGKGSSFIVRLPLEAASGEIPLMKTEAPVSISKQLQSLRILIIDDDKLQLVLTTAMLKSKGFQAEGCQQIDVLIETLRHDKYDVLLTDVQMPAMNGFDLLKLLRNSNIPQAQKIPVIAVTARSHMSGEEYIRHGFSGYLDKPFSVDDLIEVLGLPDEPEVSEDMCEQYNDLEFAALTAFSVDDDKLGRQIIQSFIEETSVNYDRMTIAFECEDMTAIAEVSHRLIPLFSLIGARQTTEMLTILERKKSKAFTKDLGRLINDTLKMINSIIAAARKYQTDNT